MTHLCKTCRYTTETCTSHEGSIREGKVVSCPEYERRTTVEKFKTGDRVKFKSIIDAKCVCPDPNRIYTINEINREKRMVQLVDVLGHFYISRFELAEPGPFKIGDYVTYTGCDIGKQNCVGVNRFDKVIITAIHDGPVQIRSANWEYYMVSIGSIKAEAVEEPASLDLDVITCQFRSNPSKKYVNIEVKGNRIIMNAIITPPTTEIIHRGTTTIVKFADDSKIVTRPSPDDVNKYDPFIGWCVAVTEKIMGGKTQAKKFYSKHVKVQRVPTEKSTEQKERVCNQHCKYSISGVCSKPQRGNVFYDSRILPEGVCGSFEARDCDNCYHTKYKAEPCPCEECKDYDHWSARVKQILIKECFYSDVCQNDECVPDKNPCKKCYEDFNDGKGHTRFKPKGDEKVEPEPSENRKIYDNWVARRSCLACVNEEAQKNKPPCMKCWNTKGETFGCRPNFAAKLFKE